MKYTQEELMKLIEKLKADESWEKDEMKRKRAADSIVTTFIK